MTGMADVYVMAPATHPTAIFPWLESYSVGVPEVDTQHKGLIRLINELHAAMASGKGKQSLGKIFDELVRYTESHFTYEEKLLKEKGYSSLVAHQAAHAKLKRQVVELRDRQRNSQLTMTVEVMQFLKGWLTDHILQHDQAYSREFAGRSR